MIATVTPRPLAEPNRRRSPMSHFQLLMAANYEMQQRMSVYAQNAEIMRHVVASFHEQLAEIRRRLEAVESGLCTTRETGAILSLVGLAGE